jgi:hypothetical protein
MPEAASMNNSLNVIKRCTVLALAMACASSTARSSWAVPIAVNFEAALVPSGGEQPLPIFVNNSAPDPDSVRLRFSVPSAALIDSLNSVRVSVNVYDDGDGPNNETGDVVFVLNGVGQSNFVVTSFNNGLNGTTAASPLAVSDLVDPANFTSVLGEIKDDGIFFVRLNRTGGDYFVQSGSVTIDANLVPEPASGVLAAIGFAIVLGMFSLRGCQKTWL